VERPASILVVEGDMNIRHPLAEYLRDCGFKVHEASNGKEAQLALQSKSHRPDVVLADMATEGSGFLLARWIRENKIDVEIVMAGSPEKFVEQAENLCEEGSDLPKPYEHEVVLQRIRQMLSRRRQAGKSAEAS
jgi:DNA-binding response OmpR family regulator